ncbi:hypothetical protein ES708_04773 [subsurface metagenome]
MDQKAPVIEVTDLLVKMQPVTSGLWYLYAINKVLAIRHVPSLPKHAHVVSVLNSTDINVGLHPRKCQQIANKIRSLRRDGIL